MEYSGNMLVLLPTLTNRNLFTMNFSNTNGLDQAQNLATPYILRHQLQDMVRSNAFYKDLAGDIKTRDEAEGGSPTGEQRVLRDFAVRNLCDFLGSLNNIIEELNKLSTNSLVPAPRLRETIYEVVGGFKAEGDQGSSLAQYANLLYLSMNQIFGTLIQMNGNGHNMQMHALQNRISGLTGMFSAMVNSTGFLQHRVIVDDQGRAVVQLTGVLREYTVEDHPRAFFSGQNTFPAPVRRSAYGNGSLFKHDASDYAGANDLGAAAAANLSRAGLADAASNAQAMGNGNHDQRRDPNAY